MLTNEPARQERSTVPPAKADEKVLRFEQAIRESGESKARWSHLMALLEEGTP